MTFHGWFTSISSQSVGGSGTQRAGSSKKGRNKSSGFAKVTVPVRGRAAVEIVFPNGVRLGIRHEGSRDELVELVRSLSGLHGAA